LNASHFNITLVTRVDFRTTHEVQVAIVTPGRGSGHARVRRLAAGAVLILLAQVPGAVQADTQQELERARAKVKRIEKELRSAQARLRVVRAAVESLIRQVQETAHQKFAIERHIKDTNRAVKKSGRRVGELRGRLNERARDVYIRGPLELVEVVLEADSLVDASDRVAFVDALSRSDANLATGIEAERQQLRHYVDELARVRKDQVALLKLLRAKSEDLEAKLGTLLAVQKEIAGKLAEAKEAVKTLEKKRQQELLASIVAGQGRPPPDLAEPGPFFACPVDQPRAYINDFGFPRVGHTHQGNDIFAPYGTPIRAPFDGNAVEGSNGLGGLSVHVYAGNGTGDYVYNAHLSQYAGVSGAVTTGQLIGYVGDSGNAEGTPPHDHFEYHPGGGPAVTPYFYLNEVCGPGGAG
jgi:peptidoglycan LD-endopeptidase LytH